MVLLVAIYCCLVGFIFRNNSFDQATLSGFSGAIPLSLLMLVLAFKAICFFIGLCSLIVANTLDKGDSTIKLLLFFGYLLFSTFLWV